MAELQRIQEPKGEFLFWSGVKPGASVATLLPGLAQQVLARMASGEPVRRVKVGARANGDFRYQLT